MSLTTCRLTPWMRRNVAIVCRALCGAAGEVYEHEPGLDAIWSRRRSKRASVDDACAARIKAGEQRMGFLGIVLAAHELRHVYAVWRRCDCTSTSPTCHTPPSHHTLTPCHSTPHPHPHSDPSPSTSRLIARRSRCQPPHPSGPSAPRP